MDIEKKKSQNGKKKFRLKIKYKIAILVFLIIIIGSYMIGLLYFNGKFLSQTTVNGIDVSHLSVEEAHAKIEDKIMATSLNLTFVDNEKETLTVNDSGIQYNQDNHLKDLYNSQNHLLWFMNFFNEDSLTLKDVISVDDKQLTTTIKDLKHLGKDQQIAPVDAKVVYKDKDFSIVKEDNGTTINTDQLKEIVKNAFADGDTDVNVFDKGGYVLPKITAKDEKLNNLLEASKKYANASITYKTISGNVVLDGSTIMSWLSIDESGKYYRDEKTFKEKASAFVKDLSKKINNIGTTRTFTLANGRRVTVSGGNYGLKLNQDKEVEGLLKDIADSKHETRTPVTSGVQASTSNNGLGNTFVEVDLTKQHMYYVKNGSVVLQSDCVTGKDTDPDRRTPAGTYYLYFKQRDRVLRGTRNPDGTWPYETPVSYWMAFNQGIGLHDASSWRSQFGGNIYINNGSHGCVNLPTNIAAQLYNSITVNTPVVVHY